MNKIVKKEKTEFLDSNNLFQENTEKPDFFQPVFFDYYNLIPGGDEEKEENDSPSFYETLSILRKQFYEDEVKKENKKKKEELQKEYDKQVKQKESESSKDQKKNLSELLLERIEAENIINKNKKKLQKKTEKLSKKTKLKKLEKKDKKYESAKDAKLKNKGKVFKSIINFFFKNENRNLRKLDRFQKKVNKKFDKKGQKWKNKFTSKFEKFYNDIKKQTEKFNQLNSEIKSAKTNIIGNDLASEIESHALDIWNVKKVEDVLGKELTSEIKNNELEIESKKKIEEVIMNTKELASTKFREIFLKAILGDEDFNKMKARERLNKRNNVKKELEDQFSKHENLLPEQQSWGIDDSNSRLYLKILQEEEKEKEVSSKDLARKVALEYVDGTYVSEISPEDIRMLLSYLLEGEVKGDDVELIIDLTNKFSLKPIDSKRTLTVKKGKAITKQKYDVNINKRLNQIFGSDNSEIKPEDYLDKVKNESLLIEGRNKEKREKNKETREKNIENKETREKREKNKETSKKERRKRNKEKRKRNKEKRKTANSIQTELIETPLQQYQQFASTNSKIRNKLEQMKLAHEKLEEQKKQRKTGSKPSIKLPEKETLVEEILSEEIEIPKKKGIEFNITDVLSKEFGSERKKAAYKLQKFLKNDNPESEKEDAAWEFYTKNFDGLGGVQDSIDIYGKYFTDKDKFIEEIYKKNYIFRFFHTDKLKESSIKDPFDPYVKFGKEYGLNILLRILKGDEKYEFFQESIIKNDKIKIPAIIAGGLGGLLPLLNDKNWNAFKNNLTWLGGVGQFWSFDKAFEWKNLEEMGRFNIGSSTTLKINNQYNNNHHFGTDTAKGHFVDPSDPYMTQLKFDPGLLTKGGKDQLENLSFNANIEHSKFFNNGWNLKSSGYLNSNLILGNKGNLGVDPASNQYGQQNYISRLLWDIENLGKLGYKEFLPSNLLNLNGLPFSITNIINNLNNLNIEFLNPWRNSDFSLPSLLNYNEADKQLSNQPTRSILNFRTGFSGELNQQKYDTFKDKNYNFLTAKFGFGIESYDNWGKDFQVFKIEGGLKTEVRNLLRKRGLNLTIGGTYANTFTNDLEENNKIETLVITSELSTEEGSKIFEGLKGSFNLTDNLLKNKSQTTYNLKLSKTIPTDVLNKYGKFEVFLAIEKKPAVGSLPSLTLKSLGIKWILKKE